ncbi:hypothetical protein VTO42DRAFT_4508 [Malbranchea cinnamomea]
MAPGYEPPVGARPGDILLAVHNFDARGDDELTLRRGDKIELLELDEGFGDGWYLGRHVADNRTGIFPGVFTTLAPRVNNRSQDHVASSDPSIVSSNENNQAPNTAPIEEATPQASRHVSLAGSQSAAGSLPEDQAGPQPLKHEQSWSTNPSSSAAVPHGVTINETMESRQNEEDSPVLNETLSVIDEHITNFSTPRQSIVPQEQLNDSSSEYSTHIGNRLSYIPGTETDEEEENYLTEDDVRQWDARQTAQHLRALGVEPKHCDIFEQEEITGDVLLEMDQEFIFMKDFNFGVMGRRLKTWHKIKAFQEEIRGVKSSRQSLSYSISSQRGRGGSGDYGRSQSHSGTVSFLPRLPSVNESHRRIRSRSDTSTTFETVSPTSSPRSFTQMRTMGSSRPSADAIRRSNYHRRHSSIEADGRHPRHGTLSYTPGKPSPSHRDKVSFDRNWTMATGKQALQNRPGTALGMSDDSVRNSPRSTVPANHSSAASIDPIDFDRGYFSGGEIDSRRSRTLLRKQESAGRSISHSRQSSGAGDYAVAGAQHARLENANSSRASVTSPTPQPYQDGLPNTRIRARKIEDMEMVADKYHSPTVTNLEVSSTPTKNGFASLSSLHSKQSGDSGTSPTSNLRNVGPKFRRAIGLRAISDAVTGTEKSILSSPPSMSPAKESLKSPNRANSGTPSGGSKSFEIDSTDSSLKGVDAALAFSNIQKAVSNRSKSKKETSAYMRGLEKKTPQEQIVGCDFYGWMKKKSSGLMGTWKPRLFVLRGRRLSYYYSEDDTEERGLIDISSHRVFRVDQDTITSLHATLTGSKSSPSPSNISTPDVACPSDATAVSASEGKSSSSGTPFIFKLVPPKAGSARGVQFTKPTVHYFQVDNIQQGRLWMAALMKANIERDLNLPVKTTNKQKTISLRKARAMNHRPPALMEYDVKEEQLDDSETKVQDSRTDDSPASSNLSSILALRKLEGLDTGPPSPSSDPAQSNDRPSSS